MRLEAERVDDYLAAHQTVWPEMLDALRETGWRDYSLFVDRPTGLVVGTLETDDFEAAQAAMNEREVNERWQAGMAEFFGTRPRRTRPCGPSPSTSTLTDHCRDALRGAPHRKRK